MILHQGLLSSILYFLLEPKFVYNNDDRMVHKTIGIEERVCLARSINHMSVDRLTVQVHSLEPI